MKQKYQTILYMLQHRLEDRFDVKLQYEIVNNQEKNMRLCLYSRFTRDKLYSFRIKNQGIHVIDYCIDTRLFIPFEDQI